MRPLENAVVVACMHTLPVTGEATSKTADGTSDTTDLVAQPVEPSLLRQDGCRPKLHFALRHPTVKSASQSLLQRDGLFGERPYVRAEDLAVHTFVGAKS